MSSIVFARLRRFTLKPMELTSGPQGLTHGMRRGTPGTMRDHTPLWLTHHVSVGADFGMAAQQSRTSSRKAQTPVALLLRCRRFGGSAALLSTLLIPMRGTHSAYRNHPGRAVGSEATLTVIAAVCTKESTGTFLESQLGFMFSALATQTYPN